MSGLRLRTTIPTARGDIDVSTIDLSFTGFGNGFETCLFGPATSGIVECYANSLDAAAGHDDWVERIQQWDEGLRDLPEAVAVIEED